MIYINPNLSYQFHYKSLALKRLNGLISILYPILRIVSKTKLFQICQNQVISSIRISEVAEGYLGFLLTNSRGTSTFRLERSAFENFVLKFLGTKNDLFWTLW